MKPLWILLNIIFLAVSCLMFRLQQLDHLPQVILGWLLVALWLTLLIGQINLTSRNRGLSFITLISTIITIIKISHDRILSAPIESEFCQACMHLEYAEFTVGLFACSFTLLVMAIIAMFRSPSHANSTTTILRRFFAKAKYFFLVPGLLWGSGYLITALLPVTICC